MEKAMAAHSITLIWNMDRGAWWAAIHGVAKSDRTERLHFHFPLSCIGEGNGNPLQCSCLENPRDRGTWWAAVYGVAQSRTQLKRLSSSIVLYNHKPISHCVVYSYGEVHIASVTLNILGNLSDLIFFFYFETEKKN